jgi:hypothetical protein
MRKKLSVLHLEILCIFLVTANFIVYFIVCQSIRNDLINNDGFNYSTFIEESTRNIPNLETKTNNNPNLTAWQFHPVISANQSVIFLFIN